LIFSNKGKKKDAKYIAQIMLPHCETFEKMSKNSVDLIIFDGASNVQGAGHIVGAYHKRTTTIKGGEHVCALFFSDVFNVVKEFRVLKAFNNSLYNLFGGTRHVAGRTFLKFSKAHNKGREVGLLRAADTRMAGHAISLMRTLRLSSVIKQTVVSREITQGSDVSNVSLCGIGFLFNKLLTLNCFIHRLILSCCRFATAT
jgi:hypothetical protein